MASVCRAIAAVLATMLIVGCDVHPPESGGATPDLAGSDVVELSSAKIAEAGIEIERVTSGVLRTYRDFPATVQPNGTKVAEITTMIRGRAERVHVDVGQDVVSGQVLATLHSPDLALAQTGYLVAHARAGEAGLIFQRAKRLLEEKVIAVAEYQKRDAQFATARAEEREAEHRLHLLGMSPAEIRQLAKDEAIRSEVMIRAPFDGRIIARHLTRGEVLETSHRLFLLADLSDVWVVANIPEKDIGMVSQTDPVEVRLTAYPGEVLTGRIGYIGDVLDPATRTIGLRVVVANPSRRLKPEMFAAVRLWLQPAIPSLLVPAAALQRDGSEDIVFVETEPRHYARRVVKVGAEGGQTLSVIDGLQEGDRVVTRGSFRLKSELIAARHAGVPR